MNGFVLAVTELDSPIKCNAPLLPDSVIRWKAVICVPLWSSFAYHKKKPCTRTSYTHTHMHTLPDVLEQLPVVVLCRSACTHHAQFCLHMDFISVYGCHYATRFFFVALWRHTYLREHTNTLNLETFLDSYLLLNQWLNHSRSVMTVKCGVRVENACCNNVSILLYVTS